jgi:hypothetical protein
MDQLKDQAETIPPAIDYAAKIMDLTKDTQMEEPIYGMSNGRMAVVKLMPTTLEMVCVSALNFKKEGEEPTNEEIGDRWQIIKRVKKREALSTTDRAEIIKRAKMAFGSMVAGQIEDLLEVAK